MPESDLQSFTPNVNPAPPEPVLLADGNRMGLAQPWATSRQLFPIVYSVGRAQERNAVSDFRTGEVAFDGEMITLQGKAVLPRQTRTLILLFALLLRLGWIVAYLVIEYAIRVNRVDTFTWENIECIVLDPAKQRVCIGYHLPAAPKQSYGLGLKLAGPLYPEFVDLVRSRIPDRVREGKILSATPLWQWIVVGVIFAIVIITVIALAMRH